MERINKLFDEIRDVEEHCDRYKAHKSEIAALETEISELQRELREIETKDLRNQIRRVEEEYQRSLADIDTFALNTLECHKISDLKMVLSRIKETEVVKTKSLKFLRSLFYVTGLSNDDVRSIVNLDYEICVDGRFAVFVIDKAVEEVFSLLAEYPEVQRGCYDLLISSFCEDTRGILPDEMRLYHDDASLCFIFQTQDAKDMVDGFHKRNIRLLGMEKLSGYRIISHVVFKTLRENLRTEVVRRGLSDERIEENNVFFDKSDFYIHNITEWKVDTVMKEIIDMTRKMKDTRIEEVQDRSDKTPSNVSADYKKWLMCFEMFQKSKSRRYEKGMKVIDRAILKLLDRKRYEPSIYNCFVAFADIAHFLRAYPECGVGHELSRRKEELFFEIVREASRIRMDIGEPLMMLKLYFKEKHVDFVENLKLFIPRINQKFFEIQFFELLNEGLMDKILRFGMSKTHSASDFVSLIDYILDLCFHLPGEAIRSLDKLRSYRLVLSRGGHGLAESYSRGEIHIPYDEFVSLCSSIPKDPRDTGLQ